MSMKFEIGTKVKIRTDLKTDELYNGIDFSIDMKPYIGKEAKIVDYNGSAYFLDIDNRFWSWGEKMLEEVSNTPTLDRMLEIQEQSELCGEFLDWFLGKYAVFERGQRRESSFVNADGASDYINKEKLLAEFFGIDLEEAEKERELILKSL
ncbi:hypothetical protein FMM74_014065 [Lachnospiraceae bacterium MD308]|nr:hypothetical protein [Lachnospiraceae bacterium MD308]